MTDERDGQRDPREEYYEERAGNKEGTSWFSEDAFDREDLRREQAREVSLNPLLADEGVGLDRLNVHYEAATEQPMLSEQTDPASLSPEEQAIRDEFRVTFLRAFAGLPEEQRHALLLHTRDGLSYEDVAQREGITTDEARRRIEAAERVLGETITREYEGTELPQNQIMYEAFEDIALDDETLNELMRRLRG